MTAPRNPRIVQADLAELRKLAKALDKAYPWAFHYGYDNGPSGLRVRGEDAHVGATKGTVGDPTQRVAFSQGKQHVRNVTRSADQAISQLVSDARSALQSLADMFEHGSSEDDWDEATRMGQAGKFGRTASRGDLQNARAAKERREERGESFGQG